MNNCNQFTIFNRVSELSTYDIFVVTGNEPKLFPQVKVSLFRKMLKVLELIVCHIELGRKILSNRDKEAIIAHGFSTEFLIFTYISSFFWAKNVYILTHHNIQQAFHNSAIRLVFEMYHNLGYRFIVNESSSALKNIGFSDQAISQHLSLLHPVVEVDLTRMSTNDPAIEQLSNREISRKKIGLVGKVRQGKQFSKTLDLLLKLQKSLDFLLVIGTDDFSSFSQINLDGAKLVNTSSEDNYFAVLASCDTIVLNYEKSKYFYRCSGVAADAIGTRTYVVCPNFPLMSHQLNYPAQVGILYENESDLETAIKKALELPPALENPAFESHHVERSIENISLAFANDIKLRIESSQKLM
jgi:hypothetical protein